MKSTSETLEEKDRKNWEESEYSKKGSMLYISYPKWKRLSCRICRVKTTIHLSGLMGESEHLTLDSAHHPIGMTRESLDKYVREIFLRKPFVTYWIEKWNIRAA